MRPEEMLEKKFVSEVKKLGYKSIKFEIVGKKGAPDQMVLLPFGTVLFFEFKRPNGGSVSVHQQVFIDELKILGFQAYVVDSWERPLQIVKSHIKAMGNL